MNQNQPLKPFSGELDSATDGFKPFEGKLDDEKSSVLRRGIGDTAISLLKGAISVPETVVGIADLPTKGYAGKVAETLGFRPKDAKAALDDLYSPEQKAANQTVRETKGFLPTISAAIDNPSVIAHTVAESLPSMLAGGVVGRGVMAAVPKVGAIGAGAIGEGVIGAGSSAEQIRQQTKDGLLTPVQSGAALASGVGTGVLGAVGGKVAKKMGIGDIDTLIVGGKATAGTRSLPARIAGGAVSEGVLEEMPQSAQEQIWQNVALGKPTMEGVPESAATGMLAGVAMGAGGGVVSGPGKQTPAGQPAPDQTIAGLLPSPVNTGTPNEQVLQSDVDRANAVAAAQANADSLYQERAAFEAAKPQVPAKLPEGGTLAAIVNLGIDSGATTLSPQAAPALRERDFVPPPTGSFGQMNEFAGLLDSEKTDIEARKQSLLTGQQLRHDSALESTDARVADASIRESNQRRDELLASVLDKLPEGQNPSRAFGRALREQGYTDTFFRPEESARIASWKSISREAPTPEVIPSAPNELDPAALGIKERQTPEVKQAAKEALKERFAQTRAKHQAAKEQANGSIPAAAATQVALPSIEATGVELPGSASLPSPAPAGNTGAIGGGAEVVAPGVRPAVSAGTASPQDVIRHYPKGQAMAMAGRLTHQGFPSEAYPHPTIAGAYAIGVKGAQDTGEASTNQVAKSVQISTNKENRNAVNGELPVLPAAAAENQPAAAVDAASNQTAQAVAQPKKQPAKVTKARRIDPERDSLFMAIAKLGGISTSELTSNGVDPASIHRQVTGKPSKKTGQLPKPRSMPVSMGFNLPLHKASGMSFDGVLEQLKQYGYFPEDATKNDVIDAFSRELSGDRHFAVTASELMAQQDAESRDAEMLAEQERIDAEAAAEDAARDDIGYDELSVAEQSAVDALADFDFDEPGAAQDEESAMRAMGFTEEEINAERRNTQERNVAVAARSAEPAQGSIPQGDAARPSESFSLESQTNAELAAREAEVKAREEALAKQEKEAEQLRKADAERADFGLTGSDRQADVGAARGQGDIFSQPDASKESAKNLSKPAKDAKPAIEAPAKANTEDSGVELTYNRRNRLSRGLKWDDVADKNVALRVKEVVKAKVYPKPDYAAMIDAGVQPIAAHLVKQVYDSIAIIPQTGRSKEASDAGLKLYIEAVNRVMSGTEAWAADGAAVAKWAQRQAGSAAAMLGKPTALSDLESSKSLLDAVYPGNWKDYRAEVIILGGNKLLGALQPSYDEARRAIKDIDKGWPGKREAWQQQGYKVTKTSDVASVRPTGVDGKFYIRVGNSFTESFPDQASADSALAAYKPFLLIKKSGRVASQHGSEAQAIDAARVATKREGGDTSIRAEGRSVEAAERTGPARRLDGENISSDRLKEEFGFKGINFGSWMKGEGPAKVAERQLHLNHAHDAFLDLAEIMNVPPKAMSLNGMLGLAIGAQGGGKNLAHFVPGVNEINLTRTGGAGALAHEFGHALDHYFATLAGLERQKRPYLTEHAGVPRREPVMVDGRTALQEVPLNAALRPELVEHFKAIVAAMSKRVEAPAEAAERNGQQVARYTKQVDSWLTYMRREFSAATRPGAENNSALRDAALETFDKLATRVRNADIGDGRVAISRDSSISPVISEMRDAFKEAFSRTLDVEMVKALQSNVEALKYANERMAAGHEPQQIQTNYAKESAAADKGKSKAYWSSKVEMFARAFDAFVVDTLAERAAKNSYLAGIEAVAPQGEERKTISAAFQALVDTIETKPADEAGNVAMFSRPQEIADEFQLAVSAHFKSNQQQPVKMAENTPASLRLFGWNDLPVVVQPEVLDKMHFDHGMTITQMAKLPFLLQRPMMVFGDSKNSSLVFVGEHLKSGKVALVAVKPEKQTIIGTDKVVTNMIVTGYAPENGWLEVLKRLARGELVYRDTQQETPGIVKTAVVAAQKRYAQVGRTLPREVLQGSTARADLTKAKPGDSSEKAQSGTRSPTVSAARSVLERNYTVLGQSDLVKIERELWGEEPLFSNGQSAQKAGQTAAAVRAEVASSIGKMKLAILERKGLVKIHDDISTLPQAAQKYSDAWGWFDGKTIHLIAGNLEAGQAAGVFQHEAWHAALRSLKLSESPVYQKIMERLGKIERNGMVTKWFEEAYTMIPREDRQNDAKRLNEMAAYAIQQYQSEPKSLPVLIRRFVEDLIASVRAFFVDQIGWVPKNLTAADLAALTRRYVSAMAANEPVVGPMGEAIASRPVASPSFAAEFLNELSFEDAAFRYPVSTSQTLEGNILEALPGTEYLGEDTRPDEREESMADHRYVFAMPDEKIFYVYAKGKEVWIDVSRLRTGDQGSAVYHGVANYAYNAGKVFVGDPQGLSEDAVIRRTSAMLSSALRFGTTAHIEAAPEQIKGNPDKGIEPLDWYGNDIAKTNALIHTFVTTLQNKYPGIKNARYDFSRQQFIGANGLPIHWGDLGVLDKAAASPGGRTARAGEASLRRGILIQSLTSSESGERPGLLELVFSRSFQLASEKGGLKGVFSRPSLSTLGAGETTSGESNRQYSPEQRAMFGRVGRTTQKPSFEERIKAVWKDAGKKIAQGVVDQFRPLRELGGQAYLLARLSKGTEGAVETFLHHGKLKLRDNVYDGDTSGGAIDQVFKPLQGEGDDFLWYVAANRAARLSAEDRENLFTPEDIAAGRSLAQGKTDFIYTLADGTTTQDRATIYRDTLKKFDGFNKNVMDIAEQSGLIDGESRKHWEHEFYVPFYRVNDEDGGFAGMHVKKGLVRQEAFKQLKGGTNKLNADLLENTLQNWSHLIDASAKNRAAKAALLQAQSLGIARPARQGEKNAVWYMGDVVRTIPNGTQYEEGGITKVSDGTATIREHGKVNMLLEGEEAPYLMEAINSLQYAGLGSWAKPLSAVKHWLTIGVTASPAFKIRNLIRDSLQAIGTSDLSYNPARNLKEGFQATKRDSQSYISMLASGALIRFGTMEADHASKIRRLVGRGVDASTILDSPNKLKAFYSKFLEPAVDAYNELGNRGEEITRAALYQQLTAKGMGHAEAALMARDLMDFSMQGTWAPIRFLTQTVPFMNARLQGLYKLGRASREDKKRFAMTLGATAMFSVALMLAYRDDDDWKKREDWDRDNNWWFKFGGVAFRIPKPFEIGALATLAERGVELFASDEMTGKRFATRTLSLLSDNLAMNPVPQLFKPIIDLYANKNSFTGRPIETMGMERLLPDYRYTSRTSLTARAVSTAGNAVTGSHFLSPVQVDHLVQGYFAWIGSFITGTADRIVRPMTNEPKQPTEDYWKLATAGFLKEIPEPSSRYVSQMYEQAKVLEQSYGTYRDLIKRGQLVEAAEFRQDNAAQLSKYRVLENVKKVESTINQRIRKIENNNDLTAGQKKSLIDIANRQKDRAARMVPTV